MTTHHTSREKEKISKSPQADNVTRNQKDKIGEKNSEGNPRIQ